MIPVFMFMLLLATNASKKYQMIYFIETKKIIIPNMNHFGALISFTFPSKMTLSLLIAEIYTKPIKPYAIETMYDFNCKCRFWPGNYIWNYLKDLTVSFNFCCINDFKYWINVNPSEIESIYRKILWFIPWTV